MTVDHNDKVSIHLLSFLFLFFIRFVSYFEECSYSRNYELVFDVNHKYVCLFVYFGISKYKIQLENGIDTCGTNRTSSFTNDSLSR